MSKTVPSSLKASNAYLEIKFLQRALNQLVGISDVRIRNFFWWDIEVQFSPVCAA